MESPIRLADDPRAYVSEVAKAVTKQMILMQESGHPFKDIVDVCSPFEFVYQLYLHKGLNVYVDPQGYPVGAIGFSVVPLWWAKDNQKILVEEFIVCLDDSYVGFGRTAVRRLKELAKTHNCTVIMSGNLLGTAQKQVENLYMKKADFTFSYKNFIKVM